MLARPTMPLASSRVASEKRAAAVAAAQKEEDRRRRRLSLPRSVASSTHVNESKVERRKQTRKTMTTAAAPPVPPPKSPGPTPYWQVAQERGGTMSPPMTRSQNNKGTTTGIGGGAGNVLTYSPPDQALNAQREHERNVADQAEHERRVAEAKAAGRLLVFSPSNNPLLLDKENDDYHASLTGKSIEYQAPGSDTSSNKDNSTLSLSYQQVAMAAGAGATMHDHTGTISMEGYFDNLKQHISDSLQQLRTESAAASTASMTQDTRGVPEALQLALQVLQQQNQDLLRDRQQLVQQLDAVRTQLQTLQDQQSGAAQAHAVTTTQLQAQLEHAQRQAALQLDSVERVRQQVQQQLTVTMQEKEALMQSQQELETNLQTLERRHGDAQSQLEALQRHFAHAQDSWETNKAQLQATNVQLQEQVQAVNASNDDLARQIGRYQQQVTALETDVLPSAQQSLADVQQQVQRHQVAIAALQAQLATSEQLTQDLQRELAAVESARERERVDFQQLNQDSAVAVERFQTDLADKDDRIGELFKQVGDMQTELDDLHSAKTKLAAQLHDTETAMEQQITQLNQALEDAMTDLDVSQAEKHALKTKLDALNRELEASKNATAVVQTVTTEQSAALANLNDQVQQLEQQLAQKDQELQDGRDREQQWAAEARDREKNLAATKKQLQAVTHERDDARSHVAGFDHREKDLYDKLRECERMRRELHGKVMQLMGNIRVFVRVRPMLAGELDKEKQAAAAASVNTTTTPDKKRNKKRALEETLFQYPGIYGHQQHDDSAGGSPSKRQCSSADDLTKNILHLTEPYKDRGGLQERRKHWKFGFDNVFTPHNSQDDVWEATEPLIQSAIDGYNVTLFAYGQTGSGKTHTMLGTPDDPGLISRAVHRLFEARRETEALSRGDTKVSLAVELLEVYNENVRDLLAPNSGPNGREIPLRVTSQEVIGNKIVNVHNEQDVLHVLALAQRRRCTKATASNAESSRSHMIFTIHYTATMISKKKDATMTTRHGKLHVCDLAGSERLDKSGAHRVGGALLEETKSINKSLSTLSNVIEKLQAGEATVPFRESKLTFLLRNSLGGNSKTLAIVCCNPLPSHFHESLCSLRFAEKVSKVDLKAVANFSC